MISFGSNAFDDPIGASKHEWLETNGLGGSAFSTITGMNTRRYHGLLTAATQPPVGRIVMLAKFEETLIIDGRRYDLSTNQYTGAIHPRGFAYQTGFRLDPFPVFTFEVAGLRLEKSVFMVQGQNTTIVNYELLEVPPGDKVQLELRPLVAFRDYHGTTRENGALNPEVKTDDGITSVQPYPDLPALYFSHDSASIFATGYWYHNFEYSIERERGLDYTEDLFNPFAITFDLVQHRRGRIIVSTARYDIRNVEGYFYRERERRTKVAAGLTTDFIQALVSAADQYLVARGKESTVIAGYPWFTDWGRDTMIALPGLTLAAGRRDVAKSILKEFARHVDQGMLPNRFPDTGETPEYNTVDATLWYFEAVRSFLHYTADYDFVRLELYDVLKEIIGWHQRGTRHNIHADTDGLLTSGEPGVQLTWMDARAGDWVVTPRHGKPVEIQALWYNALRVMEDLAKKFKDAGSRKEFSQRADHARKSFNELFWNDAAGCLFDVVEGDRRDASIRPNQIIALSLSNSMVSKPRAKSIIRVVERELLTPRGLRTLSPADPRYRGHYEGNSTERDSAYHQGTVWPWLMGPFITAFIKTFGHTTGRKFAADWLEKFQEHLNEACLGQISEIFDGDPPHHARGCVAQAWSVGELLRAATEDVYVKAPTGIAASAPG